MKVVILFVTVYLRTGYISFNHLIFHTGFSERNPGTTVYPIRTDHRGHALPFHMQFRQKGQATWYGRTFYHLESLNQTWTIQLSPDHHFHNMQTPNTSSAMEAGCYYRGRILGIPSYVKVSLCEGMVSLYHIYF